MAKTDDITRLGFEIEQSGAAAVENSFRNIEDSIASSLKEYQKFSVDGKKSTKDLESHVKGLTGTLSSMEKGIALASEEYGGLFHSGEMKRQERRLQDIRKEMGALTKVIQNGSQEQQQAARDRMKTLKEAADVEAKTTAGVFKKHQEEFDRLVGMKKKSLGELGQEAAKGSATAIQQLMKGDIKGLAGNISGGIKGAGEQAQKGAFDRQMAGKKAGAGAAGGKLTKLLGTFAKVAGPIAMIAGAVGMLVKLFLDLDARVKEMNKSMLDNVSLVNLATNSYGSFEDSLASSEIALQDFRATAMTDMDLRMLGMDPQEMGKVIGALSEQSNLMAEARAEGVTYKTALETAQVAALNLGVDANETAGLIGQLADITAVGFDEAAESLTQIVAYSKEAGVSTQRFFNTVQSVVGEMGLYNYRIEETAALFSRLSNIMDAENAAKFTQELSTQIKNMSSQDRLQMSLLAGMDQMVGALDRTQENLRRALDTDAIVDAAKDIGLGDIFEGTNFEEAVGNLSGAQRDELQALVTRLDESTGRQFGMYRNFLETARDDALAVSERAADFGVGDQIAIQISALENSLNGMNLQDISALMAEQRGVSSEQLRMMQEFDRNMSGDFERLTRVAAEDPESFAEVAEQMGYQVSLAEVQNGELKTQEDLLRIMTGEKMDNLADEAADQKTAAEKTAEYQRTMLDTIKYKLLDLVQGIYESILGLYDSFLNSRFFGGSDEEKDRVSSMREDAADRRSMQDLQQQRRTAMEAGDDGRVAGIDAQVAEIETKMSQRRDVRAMRNAGIGADAAGVATQAGIGGGELANRLTPAAYESLQRAGAIDSAQFDYGEATMDSFRGMEHRDMGKLERVRVGDEWLEGEEMVQYLAEMVNLTRARDEVDSHIESELEDGSFWAENTEKAVQETNRVLANEGIEISDKALRSLVDHQMQAQARGDAANELKEAFGVSGPIADQLMSAISRGDQELFETRFAQSGLTRGELEGVVQHHGVRSAGDARIVTSGIPLLDLQAGDIVVDQESLAQTMAGGRGDYVPELLRGASRQGGGSGGGGGQNVMYATFNVNGNNPSEIRNAILKVIQEWERSRSYS